MTREVVTVARQDTVGSAVRLMIDRDIGSVVVEDDGKPIGVFTERDLTRRILDQADLLGQPVGEVMATPIVSVEPGQQIVEAFELMNERHVRRLPVVDEGRLAGIVTERDLLRWVGAVAVD